MYRILGMGNALTDVLIQVDSDIILSELGLPKGSMQLIDQPLFLQLQKRIKELPKQMACGGSAANTITGVSKMGVKAGFIGTVHQDEVGDNYRNDLLSYGVAPYLLEDSQPSGQSIVFITPDHERTFATYLGAAASMEASMLKPALFDGYDLFYIEGYLVQNHELIRTAIRMAKDAGLKVALDLASYNVVEGNLDFLKELIQTQVDIVFANEEEAKSLTGLEPEAALEWMAGQVETAVVKLGKKGAIGKQDGNVVRMPASSATRVDTTGAGDLFAAGFLYGVANRKDFSECLRYGSIAAGKVIEYVGSKIDQTGWDAVMNAFNAIDILVE
ncbi:MAG: adenosine kinase [Bacteroidota bacterium]|nr:adenosine kinase [Bacteroidota bacterium]